MAGKRRKGSAPESLASVVAKSVFRFSDSQWAEVQKHSGLAVAARDEVEECVGFFRHWQAVETARPHQPQLLREIKSLQTAAARFLKHLNELSPNALAILWYPDETMPDWADARLQESKPPHIEAAISEISQLVRRLRFADVALRRERGPKTECVYDMVAELDNILAKHTGKRISRSYKSVTKLYVETVCKIADPNIGSGTIDAAMKLCISQRGGDRDKI